MWVKVDTIRGSNGTNGSAGAAATVSVGVVTTGAPGSSVVVTNSGSSSAATFDLTIPRGNAGSNGSNGSNGAAATVTLGTVTTGSPGSSVVITNSGSSAAATLNFTIPRGDVGAGGSNGSNGSAGAAATIAVGTVTSLSAGATPTVTNAGTSSAATFNFGIPAGTNGTNGSNGAAGSAATISVGTVTTGSAGSSVIITNAGTTSAATFNFTIPRGDVGATGPSGVATASGTAPLTLAYNSGTQAISGNVATGTTSAVGVLQLATSNGTSLGTAAAGSTGKAADAGHVHPAQVISIGSFNVGEATITTLIAGPRKVNVTVSGVTTTGRYQVVPTGSVTAGFDVGSAVCTTNGTLTVNVFVPLLTLGTYSIPVQGLQLIP